VVVEKGVNTARDRRLMPDNRELRRVRAAACGAVGSRGARLDAPLQPHGRQVPTGGAPVKSTVNQHHSTAALDSLPPGGTVHRRRGRRGSLAAAAAASVALVAAGVAPASAAASASAASRPSAPTTGRWFQLNASSSSAIWAIFDAQLWSLA